MDVSGPTGAPCANKGAPLAMYRNHPGRFGKLSAATIISGMVLSALSWVCISENGPNMMKGKTSNVIVIVPKFADRNFVNALVVIFGIYLTGAMR